MNDVIDIRTGASIASRSTKREENFGLKAARIREAVGAGKRLSEPDQEKVARNFHEILEDLATSDSSIRRRIVEATGFGAQNGTDSTKRLDPYVLPPTGSEARRARLAKKPGKYLIFATALAEEAPNGKSEDEYLCGLFQGASFATEIKTQSDWDEEAWASLDRLIRAMVSAVSRRENLSSYWAMMKSLNASYWYEERGELRYSHNCIDPDDISSGITDDVFYPDDKPPVPSVLIAQRPLLPPRVDMGWIEGLGDCELVHKLFLEVRLAVVPRAGTGRPAPFFEFRTRLDVIHDDLGELLLDNRYFWFAIKNALVGGERRAVKIDFDVSYDELSGEDYRLGCEQSYWGYKEVTPAMLKELFGSVRSVFETIAQKQPYRIDQAGGGYPPSRFAGFSTPWWLSAHVTSGLLEKELTEAVRSCKQLVDDYRADLQRKIELFEGEALKRWSDIEPSARVDEHGLSPQTEEGT